MRTVALSLGLLFTLAMVAVLGCQQDSWGEYKSTEGGFSILMPGNPVHNKQTYNTDVGALDINIYGLEQEGIAYYVIYMDYPDSLVQQRTPDKFLDNARDEALANGQGKLLSEEAISLNSYPGREIKIERADGKTIETTRMYLVGHRLYGIQAITSRENSSSASVGNFLDSFRLVDTHG